MNLANFQRQHKDIYEVINQIKKEIEKNNIESDVLARLINKLAGQLNVHLSSEDKFLYPNLLKNEQTKALTQEYIDEMGGIAEEFRNYKNRFNTKTKIMKDIDLSKSETKDILLKLEDRMNKEERELYLMIN